MKPKSADLVTVYVMLSTTNPLSTMVTAMSSLRILSHTALMSSPIRTKHMYVDRILCEITLFIQKYVLSLGCLNC